jgi:hypothetical protein
VKNNCIFYTITDITLVCADIMGLKKTKPKFISKKQFRMNDIKGYKYLTIKNLDNIFNICNVKDSLNFYRGFIRYSKNNSFNMFCNRFIYDIDDEVIYSEKPAVICVSQKYETNIFKSNYVIFKLLILLINKDELYKTRYDKYITTIRNHDINTNRFIVNTKENDCIETYKDTFPINLYTNDEQYIFDYNPITHITEYCKHMNIKDTIAKEILLINYNYKNFVKYYK